MSNDEFPRRDVYRLAVRWRPTVSVKNPHAMIDYAAHYSELSPRLSPLLGKPELPAQHTYHSWFR